LSDPQPRAKVLCIDDDAEMIELISLILEQHGYEVVGMTNGSRGIELALRSMPDVILLDLMMPDMDGWAVVRQLRQDPSLARIPVVVVTAKARSLDRTMGLSVVGVDDYVTKPFGPQELVSCVEGVLRRKGDA
jgi:two-component system response regulator VicR